MATKFRDIPPGPREERAVVCEEIGPVDDPTLHYIVCGKPLLTRLQQILTQTAGFALLVMTRGGRVPMLDVPLALASQELASTSEDLYALPVPASARHHFYHAIQAVASIGQAIDLLAVCMRCARDDPARAALTRRLRVATEHLRVASRLPDFGMVDLQQACCACHPDSAHAVNP
jgi:hypothetical protein